MSWSHVQSGDWYPHGMAALPGSYTMSATIGRLGSELSCEPMPASPYVKPFSVAYSLDGAQGHGAGLRHASGAWSV